MEANQINGKQRNFVCPTCPKRFYSKSNLSQHMLSHSEKRDHICDICGKSFNRHQTLKLHKLRHGTEKQFKCDQCGKSFVTLACLRRHFRTHTVEYSCKCKYCHRSYGGSSGLINHLRLHLGDEIYTCDFCPQSFRLHIELRKHLPEHKNDDAKTRESHLAARQQREMLLNLKLYSDPVRAEEYDNETYIQNSKINEEETFEGRETVCERSVEDLEFKQEHTEQLVEPYVANEIIEENDDDDLYEMHKQNATIKSEIDIETQNDYNAITEFSIKSEIEITEDSVLCETMSFKVENDDTAHIDDINETKSNILNRQCTPLPSAAPNNANHLNSISSVTMKTDLEDKNLNNTSLPNNTIEEKHACEVCGKHFTRPSSLRIHMENIHSTVERPYACKSCSYRFKSLKQLKKHNSTEHNKAAHSINDLDVVPEKFPCDECSLVLNNAEAFENHKNIHKKLNATQIPPGLTSEMFNFSCDECGIVLGSKRMIRYHKKYEHQDLEVKECICTECGKQLSCKRRLRDHVLKRHKLKKFK